MSDPFERKEPEDIINEDLEDSVELTEDLPEESEADESSNESETVQLEAAKKHGHLNEEEYQAKHGSLKGYKSPEQFNKYGEAWNEVTDVIKGMKKQLDERDKQLESLVKYQERIEDRAYQKARGELERQLQEAKNLGDVASVEYLTKEKAKQEFQESQKQVQISEQQRMETERQFMERNKHWYNINAQMTQRAREIDAAVRQEAQVYNIPLTYEALANQVEARLRFEYPDVMITGNRTSPTISSTQSAVNRGTNGTGLADSVDKVFNGLDEEHRSIYLAVKRGYEKSSGGKPYTKKDFINQLKKDGEI